MDSFTLYALFSMIFTTISLFIKFFKLLKSIKVGEFKLPSLPKSPVPAEKELKLTDEEVKRILSETEENSNE